MKKISIYTVLMLLLFLFLYWLNKDAPNPYRWVPTFHTRDKQPYGAYVFDKMMEASMKNGYTHNYLSISDLETGEMPDNYNLLIIASEFNTDEEEWNCLLNYIRRGGNAMIAAGYFSSEVEDTLKISTLKNIFSPLPMIDLSRVQAFRQIRFHASASGEKTYSVPSITCSRFIGSNGEDSFNPRDSVYRISETMDGQIISMRFRMGKGNLILACNPLLYSNYGILNDSISEYIRYHLAYLQDRPLIRTEYYQTGSQGSRGQSPFRYILSERSLRWAFYISLITIFVFMLFTAKRKQKVIPVIKPPVNRAVAFVRSIAGLYLLKNNNADIIRKKFVFLAEEMKRKQGIDLINDPADWQLYTRIAAKTGQPVENVRRLLIHLRAIDRDSTVPNDEMMELISQMNVLSAAATVAGLK
jgi:hypothetical protein